MSNTLISLIQDYQAAVERVMTAFREKFDRTDLLIACKSEKLFPSQGELKEYGIKHYSFHGIGLYAEFIDNTSVDFDFAFFPNQRHDGFDLWRLRDFVATQQTKYSKYIDRENLENDFNEMIQKETIGQLDISSPLYFFTKDMTSEDHFSN